ncbi:Os06g0221450 [Oryza sativa Japonica Group]|jgi:hypothetical protein|uniref:Os06g0221450 protein n=1 Tax=Oryza sativa subsp. japonica TaxID=39947 RepID=A0A0P0WU31_ORYSJ|nr:Os06g0221450 [Oryza sativa Japonica Group]
MAAVMLRALGNGAPDVTGERRGRDGERRDDERDGPDDERGDFLCGKCVMPRMPLSCCCMITTTMPPMNPVIAGRDMKSIRIPGLAANTDRYIYQ